MKKERKRKRKVRKEYQKKMRIAAMVRCLKMTTEGWKIGKKAETPIETGERMEEIDR